MDRKVIEKYFSVYPRIDEEITTLEIEVSDLEKKKKYYATKEDEFSKSLLQTIEIALEQSRNELSEAYSVKTFVSKAIAVMSQKQKKIIEFRFWNGKETPTKWDDVAKKLNYHRTHTEKVYKQAVSLVLEL